MFAKMDYFTYILQSEKDGSFYVGYSHDVQERLPGVSAVGALEV